MDTPCPYCNQTTPHRIEKYCPACDQTLPHTAFHKNKAQPSGLSSHCKACRNALHKTPKERQKRTTYMQGWQDRNRAKVNVTSMQAYYELKERRAADPALDEHVRQLQRGRNQRFYARHPEAAKQFSRNYKAVPENNAKINKRRRERHAEHPEKARASNRARYALRRGASVSNLTPAQWEATKAHYGYRCVYCGLKTKHLTQDHITPVSQGGPDTYTNIVPACRSCNAKKGTGAVLKPIQPLLLL